MSLLDYEDHRGELICILCKDITVLVTTMWNLWLNFEITALWCALHRHNVIEESLKENNTY